MEIIYSLNEEWCVKNLIEFSQFIEDFSNKESEVIQNINRISKIYSSFVFFPFGRHSQSSIDEAHGQCSCHFELYLPVCNEMHFYTIKT